MTMAMVHAIASNFQTRFKDFVTPCGSKDQFGWA
jgi:hypothetical protein